MPISKPSRLNIANRVIAANPAVKDDIMKWLDDSNPAAQVFETMFMAREDYSQGMNNLQTQQTQVQQQQQLLQQQRANYEQQLTQQVQQARAAVGVAVSKVQSIQAKVKSEQDLTDADFALDSGLLSFAAMPQQGQQGQGQGMNIPGLQQQNNLWGQPGAQGPGQGQQGYQPQYQQPVAPQQQQGQVTPDQLIQTIISGFAEVDQIGHEHQQLFGTYLNKKDLVTEATRQGRPVQEVYNEIYNPQLKRQELEAQKFQQTVDAAVQAKVQEMLSGKDPSGQASTLGALGNLFNQAPEDSPAFANMGQDHTAANLDPSFRTNNNIHNAQQQQQQQSQQAPPQPPPQPPQQTTSTGRDAWLADFMQGVQTNRVGSEGLQKAM